MVCITGKMPSTTDELQADLYSENAGKNAVTFRYYMQIELSADGELLVEMRDLNDRSIAALEPPDLCRKIGQQVCPGHCGWRI